MARILIVDDSTVMRKNLRAIFTREGHEVVGEAIDGKQAILLYSELKPDLVTMDISMPKINGVEAVEYIVKIDNNAKIIMISALNQKQMVFEALKNGAKHYVIKPIDPEKLIGVVNEILEENTQNTLEVKNEVKEEVDEIKPGFNINNLNGKFIVTFNEYLSAKDQTPLDTAVKGLLFVKPLSIIFDFNNLQEISEPMLHSIIKIGATITNSGGNLEYKAESESINKMLSEVR